MYGSIAEATLRFLRSLRVCACCICLIFSAGALDAQAQDTGEFEASVTGYTDTAVQLNGFARSFSDPVRNGWYVQLIIPGGASSILILFLGSDLPPTGEHRIVDFIASDAEPPPGQFVATGNLDPQLFILSGFHSVSGTIVVTASSEDSVEASFNFQARESDGGMVQVSGAFDSHNTEG